MTMYMALHPRDDVDRLYVSRKQGGRRLTSIEDSVDAYIQRLEDYTEKKQRKTYYSHQKRYWQHEDQQNDNNLETKMERKTTPWAFYTANKQHLTQENMDEANKGKPYERNWIVPNSSTNQRHKNQSYQREKW